MSKTAKKPKAGPPQGIHAAVMAFKQREMKGAKRKMARGKPTKGKAKFPADQAKGY